jgi:iron(III) transport system ATP-binding protein
MSTIKLDNVGRTFGAIAAVADVDLDVARGEFVTLLGPSGCGKTTTLRMVAGLEQNTSGCIAINGDVVSDAQKGLFVSPDRRHLGMVFQSYAIWPHMTVFDNVAYPLSVRRRPKAEIAEKVGKALNLVEMGSYAERPAPKLSGGQQQRVAIARALVFEPQVLLLDEPLSNLDAKLRAQMGDEFRNLQRRIGFTALYVTHDQEEALALSDRIVVMHGGKVMQIGTPEEVYDRPANRTVAAFFGQPNLVEATVDAIETASDGRHVAMVRGAGLTGRCRVGAPLAIGTRVLAVIRPESLTTAAGALTWSARVTETVFRGARRTVRLDTPSGPMTMEMPSSQPVRVGDTLSVAFLGDAPWAVQA